MPCLWRDYDRGDVIRKYEGFVVFPVEDEKELMLLVLLRNPAKGFEGKPPDPFELVLKQQPCVDGDPQFYID
jgi:hypothetical protein